MGTLGPYLRSAREERGIDLHDAAQQTRIGIAYLKALEEEDFSRLPGEVFVKGFLKNYGKFLRLDESQVMKKYGDLRDQKLNAVPVAEKEPAVVGSEQKKPRLTTMEPFLWGAGIVLALILFMVTSLPERRHRETKQAVTPMSTGQTVTAQGPVMQTDKLYLEVEALEDTWLLVRTDNSPQKKALLKKGESLIWSADERFLLSYGSVKSIKMVLNGRELIVNEPENKVVRDLAVIASGVVSRNIRPGKIVPRKKRLPTEQQQQAQPAPLVDPVTPQTRQTPTEAL
jgi:hypothetical protein